jgi:hypothetical protein
MRKLVLSLLLLAAAASPASAQTPGQKYHTREPHTCASMKTPSSGAPSAAQAAQYFTCFMEVENARQLVLVTDVHVEVGSGTRYNDFPAIHRPGSAATNAMIYAIRGSYKKYACEVPSMFTKEGQHCSITDNPHAEGICYITKIGDWFCTMADSAAPYPVMNQPAPAN